MKEILHIQSFHIRLGSDLKKYALYIILLPEQSSKQAGTSKYTRHKYFYY